MESYQGQCYPVIIFLVMSPGKSSKADSHYKSKNLKKDAPTAMRVSNE